MTTSTLFEPLLPSCVLVAEMDPRDGLISALAPAERGAIADAVPHRQREFAAGRQLAHRLIGELGLASGAILSHADRSPAWPAGIVGSITHCPNRIAVTVARATDVEGIGIDIEPSTPLPDGLEPLVLATEESRRFTGLSAEERALRSRWVFSAKEATYKAIYPLTGKVLEFADLVVSWEAGGFVAVLRCAAPPFRLGTRFVGRCAVEDGYIATVVVIERGQGAAATVRGGATSARALLHG
ncbi:4'-phosphopantetheinyl transferase superfamily protein [Streptomyces sp. MBT65]|uniref:4'-phosphopantetheinyl transferase family protein n=1 Tax=Streptomyces sp. MBT65 TaxID=1488395 RepID=UPI00190B2D80|nr:4'-phosphopantetheinyl transferase superfamily protein [Streptomyces sp. MBT65]MBK3576486.1 4'-phosphopantetheinyl transferase superfamily protein [Streptomyces sp. MBT65]